MSKGYAEGPAAEEHVAELERAKRSKATPSSSSPPARPTASRSAAFPRKFVLPRVEQRLDVVPLLLRELEPLEHAPRLRRIVVRDRGFQPLPQRCRLRELTAQPAQQPDGVRRRRHSFLTYARWRLTTRIPTRS